MTTTKYLVPTVLRLLDEARVKNERLGDWLDDHPDQRSLVHDLQRIVNRVVFYENHNLSVRTMTLEDIDNDVPGQREFQRINLPVLAEWIARETGGKASGDTVRVDGTAFRLEQAEGRPSVTAFAEDGWEAIHANFGVTSLRRLAQDMLKKARHSPDAQTAASVIASIDRIVAERKEAGRYDAAVGHIIPRHISIPTLARIIEHLRGQGLDVDARTAAPMAAAGFTDMVVSWRRHQASALSFNIADKDTRQTVIDGTRGGQNPYLLTSDHSDAWVFGNFCAKNNITGVVTKKRSVWTVNGKSYKVYGAEVRPYHN